MPCWTCSNGRASFGSSSGEADGDDRGSWPSGLVAEWPSGRVAERARGRVAEWPSGRVVAWPPGRRQVPRPLDFLPIARQGDLGRVNSEGIALPKPPICGSAPLPKRFGPQIEHVRGVGPFSQAQWSSSGPDLSPMSPSRPLGNSDPAMERPQDVPSRAAHLSRPCTRSERRFGR